ncbi:glycosyltransferase family 4 protein [Alteribacter keqinensis]|nr:glycosyltransferase family 4 protein [Alteribacter keqinensis]
MRVLVLANFGMGLFNFRKELLEELIRQGHEVYVSLPNDEYVPKLKELGCKYVETRVDRRGTNPINDMKLLYHYIKLIKSTIPDVVLTYTIKPNIYGGIACGITKTPYLTNVTGLGTAIENSGLIQKITLRLYRMGLRNSSCVFFQNEYNRSFFVENNIAKGKTRLIPGSGVNLEHHNFKDYPTNDKNIRFLFIGRIMKAKGIEELFQAAKKIKGIYPNVEFHLVGGSEEDYTKQLAELEQTGIIKYHGHQSDVHSFIKVSHGTILPSYHEGTANVLLETAATGRPILASKVPGCIETFNPEITGLGFEARSVPSLVEAIRNFIKLPYPQKKLMGIKGRKKMEEEYDRKIVINAYLQEIGKFTNEEI